MDVTEAEAENGDTVAENTVADDLCLTSLDIPSPTCERLVSSW